MRVVDALDDLVLKPLFGVCSCSLEFRHAVDHVDGKVEAINLVQNGELQRRVNVAFFLVAPHVEVVVVLPFVREFVDQCSIRMEVEDHRFIKRE